MERLWNCVADPSLHMLGIALLLAAVALGQPRPKEIEMVAEAPLLRCPRCHINYMPGHPCGCDLARQVAKAHP